MAFSLEVLTKPMTVAEAKTAIYDVLGVVGVKTTFWKPGAVVRTMIAAIAILFAALTVLTSQIARSGFLELSSGSWLTLVAKYVFGVERLEATFAAGEVTLDNAAGGTFSFDPDDVTFLNPFTGKTYKNAEAFTLAALETGKVVAIRAVEVGASSTSPAGTITELETPLTGVSCSNAGAVVGADEETDPALRLRCLEKLGALSPNGPADAYSYFTKVAKLPDGTSAGATRVRVRKDGYGNVTVVVGTPTGGITGDADDVSTPLGAVHDSIQRNCAPLTVTETTESAEQVLVPIAYEIWMYNDSGLTAAQIAAAIQTTLVAEVAAQPIGGNEDGSGGPGKLFQSDLTGVIHGTRTNPADLAAPRLPIFRVAVANPADDVELTTVQAPVASTITAVQIHQVKRPTL